MRTLASKTVTTRKPHTCEQCLRTIAAGENAFYWASIVDGEFGAGYLCDRCSYLHGELWGDYGDQDYGLDLAAVFSDYSGEIAPELIAVWKAPGADFVRVGADGRIGGEA